jgi:hypothetical protein
MAKTIEKRTLSSPFIYEDVSSFKFIQSIDTILMKFKPGELTSFKYTDTEGFYTYQPTGSLNNYILLNNNYDNYFYRFLQDDESKIKFKYTNFGNNKIFFTDDNLIDLTKNHTNLESYKLPIAVEDSDDSIEYDYPSIHEIFKKEDLIYSEKSNENFIYLYAQIESSMNTAFDINDYFYELRINGIPTTLYELKKIDKTNSSTASSIHNLQIKVNKYGFTKRTGYDELNTFLFIIKNRHIDEVKTMSYSRYADFMKPFVSYDSMVETTEDITINCRYDLSIPTTNQTRDTVIDIDNPSLIQKITSDDVSIERPVVDNNIIFEMNDSNINIRALASTIVHINFNPNGDDSAYIISNKDINFKEEHYKVYSHTSSLKIQNTEALLFYKEDGYNNINFVVESITDITSKRVFKFSIHFFKISKDNIELAKRNELKYDQCECIITVNFKVTINPDPKFEFTEDEQEVLSHILSFQTDTVSANFGKSSLFSIKANDNITLNESELNNTSLIEYISNGGRDLTYINNNYDNYDITFYGIYLDHMIMADSNVGRVLFNRLDDITNDISENFISNQILVCNTLESISGKDGDACKDGFNETAFTRKVNDNNKRLLIVPDTVYDLFNFLNGPDFSGCYSFADTSKEIFDLSTDEYNDEFDLNKSRPTKEKIYYSSYALYPSADFSFEASELEDETFMSTNLYVDYFPVKHRLTKKSDGTIVWTIYAGTKMKDLQIEKIIRLIANAETESNDLDSEITDEIGSIDDSGSTITYPSFINFKILMETESGDPTKIDGAYYTGKITNISDFPVLIKDISLDNFKPDSELFILDYTYSFEEITEVPEEVEVIEVANINEVTPDQTTVDKYYKDTTTNKYYKGIAVGENRLSENSFMKYEITGVSNYIATDKLNVANFTDHNDLTTFEGNLFILKPGGIISVNIYNNEDVKTIPADFGKTVNRLQDSLHYELYYIQDNTDSDNSAIKYTFRETGMTSATNMETVVTVYPFISSVNFDSEYYRYGETVYNIFSNEIENRSVVFRLVLNEENKTNFMGDYEQFTEKVLANIPAEDLYWDRDHLSFLDLESIYYLEKGKNFSYREVIKELKKKYTYGITNDEKAEILNKINHAIGIQVIARTLYTSGDIEYNMAMITNYLDLYNNPDIYLPKLNRLTGSLYHLLKIENKHDEIYDYLIMVDDKIYNEGDLIYNKYANEIALHKFRLYYKPKTTEEPSVDWRLADSFEGCIDGTKPVVPNLLTTNSESYDGDNVTSDKVLHKYMTITRDELKDIISNPKNILNENTYYGDNSIVKNVSDVMKYEIHGESGISALRIPSKSKYNDTDYFEVLASKLIPGKMQIVNKTEEKINIEINQRKLIQGSSSELSYPFTITTDAVLKNITYVNNYQPIFTIEPNTTLNIFIQFTKEVDSDYKTLLDIRVENNYRKKYRDNMKWDHYEVLLSNLQNYEINFDIIKQLLPYKFYTLDDNNYSFADYYDNYDINQDDLFNVLDVNQFNRNALYSTYIFFDNTMIYDSTADISDENYKLLIPKKILDRKMYIGDHTLTIITNKFNGLLNYNNYYITLIDHNVYTDSESINYFKNREEYYDKFLRNTTDRKSIIPRHPENDNYESSEFLNELFLDSNGDISMVTKDYSDKNVDKYYLYKFTEIIQQYMNLSSFIVDSDQYLFEKNYQEVLYDYNLCKEQYDSYSKDIYIKLDRTSGEIYRIIDKIQEISFPNFDNILDSISKELEEREEAKENNKEVKTEFIYEEKDDFISRLFANDEMMFKYRNYNILYDDGDYTATAEKKLTIYIKNGELNYQANKDKEYIFIDRSTSLRLSNYYNNLYFSPFDPICTTNNEGISDSFSIPNDSLCELLGQNTLYINYSKILRILNNNHSLDKNYKMYLVLESEDHLSNYILSFNLCNIANSLKLDDLDDMKFSADEYIVRTLTNTTNSYITFQTQFKPINSEQVTIITPDTVYSAKELMHNTDKEYDCNMTLFYQTDLGYKDPDDNTKITLPPYSYCKIYIKGNKGDNDTLTANPRELVNPFNTPTSDEDLDTYNLLDILNGHQFILGELKFKITNINIDNTDKFYNYTNDISEEGFSYTRNFIYIPYPTIYLSKIYRNEQIVNKFQKFNLSQTDNQVMLYIADLPINNSEEIFGNFSVNGGLKNINFDSNIFKSYLPFRINPVVSTSATTECSTANTYDDSYKLYFSGDKFVDAIYTLNEFQVFPIIVSKNIDSINNPSYTFTVNKKLRNINDYYRFNNISNLLSYAQLFKNKEINYKRIANMYKNDLLNSNIIYEGSMTPNDIPDGKEYKYNKSLNNVVEYIYSNLTTLKVTSVGLFYVYPFGREAYILPITESVINGIEGRSISYDNIEYKDISQSFGDDFFSYKDLRSKLFLAFKKPSEIADINTNPYAYVIDKVNTTLNTTIFDEFITKFENIINNIYEVKSNIGTVQQNIVNQNHQLESKATVKDFKTFINENIFALSEFEYSINEIFADIYYLSNKGLELSYSIDDGETIDVSLRESYPLTDIYRDYSDIHYYIGENIGDHSRYAALPNKLITTIGNTTPTGNKNGINYFYLRKYWIQPDSQQINNISSIYCKKNFIELSKLYYNTVNVDQSNLSNELQLIRYFK